MMKVTRVKNLSKFGSTPRGCLSVSEKESRTLIWKVIFIRVHNTILGFNHRDCRVKEVFS